MPESHKLDGIRTGNGRRWIPLRDDAAVCWCGVKPGDRNRTAGVSAPWWQFQKRLLFCPTVKQFLLTHATPRNAFHCPLDSI